MRFLLDTDICIYLIKKKPPSVIQKLSELANNDVAISSITLFELKYGVENSQYRQQSNKALNHFTASIPHLLPLDGAAAKVAAKIRADLKKRGLPIGPYDLLIAAIAIANNLTLISNNGREFKRIEGLKLENWVEPLGD